MLSEFQRMGALGSGLRVQVGDRCRCVQGLRVCRVGKKDLRLEGLGD